MLIDAGANIEATLKGGPKINGKRAIHHAAAKGQQRLYGGPYRLVAAPAEAVVLAGFPAKVREVAGSLRYEHLRFDQLEVISEAELTEVPPR